MFSVALLLLAAASCVKCEQLTQPASVTVQPGHRLSISCQVSYSLGSYATHWIRQPAGKGLEWIGYACTGCTGNRKESLKNKFSITLETSSKTVTLNGQNLQPEDSAVYFCARDNYGYFDYWGKGTQVTVTSASSHGPTVFPLMPCGSGGGETVTLGCLATGFTPSSVTFSWNQDATSLSDFIQYPSVLQDNAYIGISQIQVSRQLWDARRTFQCVVHHAAGEVRGNIIQPNVVYKSPTLITGSSFDGDKDEASFSCFAKDFSPNKYAISWRKDGRTLDSKIDEISSPSGNRKDANGTILYSATSSITVKSSELRDDTIFTCVFEGTWGSSSSLKTENVTMKEPCFSDVLVCPVADMVINIIGPKVEDIFLNEKGQLTCQIHVNNGHVKEIWWEDEAGTEMTEKESGNKLKKNYEHFLDITYDEWHQGVKRYCVVQHNNQVSPQKTLYERRNGETHQRPSVFMLPPVEHTRKDVVTLTCYVKDFFPQDIFVSWFVDDEEADSNYPFRTTNAVEKDGSYSAYSQLTLSLDQWKQTDVVYSCVVHHESIGNSTKSIVRSIGYRTLDKTNLVNLNMNVPEKCKA